MLRKEDQMKEHEAAIAIKEGVDQDAKNDDGEWY